MPYNFVADSFHTKKLYSRFGRLASFGAMLKACDACADMGQL